MAIDVFADVCCPFTHAGLRRFVAERARRDRNDIVLRLWAWPLELVNGAPLDAAFIAEEVEAIRQQVAPDLFTGFREDAFPASSIPAMAVASRAYEISDVVGERVSLAVRDALFEQGRDIGRADVLAEILDEMQVAVTTAGSDDRAIVQREWDAGVGHDVIGSPHFIVGSGDFFCPSLGIERVDGDLRIETDDDGFERFWATLDAGRQTGT